VEAPLDLYIRILAIEFRTHHILKIQLAKLPFLV
jgi:hypothetical protein